MSRSIVPLVPLLHISQATRRFGLTQRALRHYEDLGLVRPTRDRRNGRCYDAAAVRRLEWIATLRRAGVSLGDVRSVLEADGEDACARAKTALWLRRGVVEAELDAVRLALSQLDESSPAAERRSGNMTLVG